MKEGDMKKNIVSGIIICLVTFYFDFASAQIQGKFWFGGMGAYLDYKEKEAGKVLDKDYGWLPGFEGGFLLSERDWMLRIMGRRVSGDVTYDGQTSEGVPLKFDNEHETIWSVELNYGYTFKTIINVTPYVGIGYRKWVRGKAQLVQAADGSYVWNYKEVYKWGYVPVGVILEKRFLRSFKIGFDAAVVFPFNMEMTAYLSEIGGSDLDFDLGWHVGGRCELPIAWYIRPATAFYINPFYRYWNIGESNIVSGFYEPHSITHYYGVSCGVMFEF